MESSMDKTTTGALKRWFEAALEQPETTRTAWLMQHCLDEAARAKVLALLAAHADQRTDLLDIPVASMIERWGEDGDGPAPESLVGTHIGAFRLTGLLGQGGMATVYLAEREGVDFKQRVAVKLMRRGLYSELEQQLFVRERRTLATLSHPNIARLIDGGVTDADIPYLVMEHVDGMPITRHATEHKLGLRARLQLFHLVCRAVDAAHRQLVVHRDIKPSNLLVTADGEVKLLDFGIATLLDDCEGAGGGEETLRALTPGYAAPEQYAGGPISTATDVHALGVLLHELLLGERPGSRCDRPSLRTQGIDRAPSTIPISSAALGSALRGDLDSLLLKALAPDPEQRYASAGALADDLQRHLRNEPIEARPPSAAYRMQKFIRRHRGGVSITAALALAVLASLGTALWQARVAHAEAQRANGQALVAQREALRANGVRDLLVELFENESPGAARSQLPDTATLLQRGAARARTELAATPALQVEMLVTIARVYSELSQFDQARPLLVQALATARQLPAEEYDILVDALAQMGELELGLKRYDAAQPLLDEALSLQRPHYPEGLTTASLLHQRGLLYSETDRNAEAIADYLDALAIRRKRLGPRHPMLIRSYGALGTAYANAKMHAKALPWMESALELSREVHGNTHDETARRLSNLSISLMAMGKPLESERASAEAVAISRKVFSGPNAAFAPRLHNLGAAQLALGKLPEAEASLREAIDIERAIGRGKSPGVAYCLAKLARIEELRGNLASALALAEQSSVLLDATLPPLHTQRLEGELRAMRLRLMQPEPVDLRAAAAELQQRIDGLDEIDTEMSAAARYVHGFALARMGQDATALPLLEQAIRMTGRPRPLPHDALHWFITLSEVRARLGDQAGARDALRAGIAYADRWKVPPTHPARAPLVRALTTANATTR